MDVQAGTRSCRHAAKEVMEWSDEQAAEIAALKAEVERLTKREGILVDHMSEMLTKAKDNPEQQASFLEIAGYCIMELDRADKAQGGAK